MLGGGDQLSSREYEELLGILIDHKWTFDDYLLNIVQKINQKNTHPGKTIKVHASKEDENYHESISYNFHIVNLDNS